MIDGQTVRGLLHPAMGHIHVRRDPHDLQFAGICPFHRGCLEGLASGPAIQARRGASLDQLGMNHVAYEVIGNQLGQLAATIVLMVASERIVFGGGVMQNAELLPHIRRSWRIRPRRTHSQLFVTTRRNLRAIRLLYHRAEFHERG